MSADAPPEGRPLEEAVQTTPTGGAAVIIPAHNESPTVGGVVDAARAADLVVEVIVVDNGSWDGTGEVAREHGARVVRCVQKGKGQAMRAGVAATSAPVVCFLDADLLDLRPEHIDRLVGPVLRDEAGMTLGLFDRGPELNPIFLNALPRLTGQRALRRELFEAIDPKDTKGFKVEAALNARADELGLVRRAFICEGVRHRGKEQKAHNGLAVGLARKVAMLVTAVWSYASYATIRPVRERLVRLRRRIR